MAKLLELLLAAPLAEPLLSLQHFWADFALLWAWASRISLERIDGLGEDLPPLSGDNRFGSGSGGKKRAKGDFR